MNEAFAGKCLMGEYRLDLENELKQSPIDDAAILSSVANVIGRHNKYLEKSQRRNRFRIGYATLLIVGITAIAITLTPLWETIFDAKTAANSEVPLVEGDGIRIMPEEFLLYKSGVEEANKQAKMTPLHVTDQQIVDNLIKDQLTIQYAKKLGIVASPEEVDTEITFQRNALEQSPKDNPVRELIANRIKKSGITEDEFWNSQLVRRQYENSVLGGKLFTKLIENGAIKRGDGSEFSNFKNDLFAANKEKLTINWSALENK